MSLMLNALKRIEAKQASLRKAVAPAVEPIEIPPELTADTLADSEADIALPGPVSIDTSLDNALDIALDDLSDLIAEARLLDQPPLDEVVPEANQAVVDDVILPADDARSAEVHDDVMSPTQIEASVEAQPLAEVNAEIATEIDVDGETPVNAEVSFVIAEDLLDMLHDSSPADWLSIEAEADMGEDEADAADRFVWSPEESVPEVEAASTEFQDPIEHPAEAVEETPRPSTASLDWALATLASRQIASPPRVAEALHEDLDSMFAALAASAQAENQLPPAVDEAEHPLAVENDSPEFVETAATPDFAADEMVTESPEPDASEEVFEPAEEDAAESEPETEHVEPQVVQPVGSDPYAATAWQILSQLPQGRSQVLMFTSPADGHGKTMTLARLLPHLARNMSGNVLVVDANTRNPDMARRLDVAATWRLTDVLAGATDWMNAVRPTTLPRVSVLPGGSDGSRRTTSVQPIVRLLRELTAHYDLVIVDASSLAHDGAAQLAATCDATYLVVRLGEGNRRILRDAVRVIDQAGGRLLGCVAVDAGT